MKTPNLKMNPLSNLMKKSLLDLPTPASISFMWNTGFLLGMVLMTQIATGILISMLFTATIETAFTSMIMIMRDSKLGWASRLTHMNGASLFFILIYLHTARGIYFTSPKSRMEVWMVGVTLMLVSMATAFLGYVLPWGQMSFWGATVITGVISAIPLIGQDLVTWIWGGPSVSQPTLNRFFSLHFLTPMLIMGLAMSHMMLLHQTGSSNPSNSQTNMDKIKFNPMLMIKDLIPLLVSTIFMMILISNFPNALGDVENFNPANSLVAPLHIQPEWYFLFAYVILRSVPSKLGGVIALIMSILILTIMSKSKNKTTKFSVTKKTMFWFFASSILILTWIGTKTVEPPFEKVGQIYTILYFSSILLL